MFAGFILILVDLSRGKDFFSMELLYHILIIRLKISVSVI